jgi:hypothetical protein
MQTINKEIDGINCEIETADGYSDISIEPDNTRLQGPEWIVRKAPEAIAEQIASAVIQHLLLTPEPPKEISQSEAWVADMRTVSHDAESEGEALLGVIAFRIGYKLAFQLTYRTIL